MELYRGLDMSVFDVLGLYRRDRGGAYGYVQGICDVLNES